MANNSTAKSDPTQSAKETHFGLLCFQFHSLSCYPELEVPDEDRNVDW